MAYDAPFHPETQALQIAATTAASATYSLGAQSVTAQFAQARCVFAGTGPLYVYYVSASYIAGGGTLTAVVPTNGTPYPPVSGGVMAFQMLGNTAETFTLPFPISFQVICGASGSGNFEILFGDGQ